MPKKPENKVKKSTEQDESENPVVIKMTTTTEKFTSELGNKVNLTQECADIDKQTDNLEAKVNRMVKGKYSSEDEHEHFADLRNIYLQIAACVGRLDDISGKVIHSLNGMFKAKKAGDVEEVEDDTASGDEQPTKIGKPKKESKSKKSEVNTDDEDDNEGEDEDEKPVLVVKKIKSSKTKEDLDDDDEPKESSKKNSKVESKVEFKTGKTKNVEKSTKKEQVNSDSEDEEVKPVKSKKVDKKKVDSDEEETKPTKKKPKNK